MSTPLDLLESGTIRLGQELRIRREQHLHETPPSLPQPHSFDNDEQRINQVCLYIKLRKIFTLMDIIGLGYRHILPIPIWICYFENGPGSDILPYGYIIIKFILLSSRFKLIILHITHYVVGKMEFGRYANEEDISRCGTQECSICYDSFLNPIIIPCKHIFCEHCISEWLDAYNTCPVCRSNVKTVDGSSGEELKELATSFAPIFM